MAVFHGPGPMGMSDRELGDCDVFDNPIFVKDATGNAYDRGELAKDPQLQKVHDKIQTTVAKKLRSDQYKLQPAKMILARATKMRAMSYTIVSVIQDYKKALVDLKIYSNDDINKLVDLKYDLLYKDMENKLDIEYPCNEEAKK